MRVFAGAGASRNYFLFQMRIAETRRILLASETVCAAPGVTMTRTEERRQLLLWYAMEQGCIRTLSKKERLALEEWDTRREFPLATSDWPGFERYIGKCPEFGNVAKGAKKQFIPLEIRWKVWERDNFTCVGVGCGARTFLSVDHIIAESKGGPLELRNLQTLCRSCNSKKGNR